MKHDIDSLMLASHIDVLLITGAARHNPDMTYLTGIVHLTRADLIKVRGQAPVLFHASMERDEAAQTGLLTKDLGDYNYKELLEQADGNPAKASALRYAKMLAEVGMTTGRLSLAGKAAIGPAYAVFSELRTLLPNLSIIGEMDESVLLRARATKDENEIQQMRQIGEITVAVVAKVADFLTSQRAKNGVLVRADGEPITVGEVKRRINLWLAEAGAENPEGTIFAIGRDAAVPHSTGKADDLLRLGQTIVFDIFPCQAGGGYFHDMTRTWCLGYAPDEAMALYEQVLEVYRQIVSELRLNVPCKHYQERTCELFEAKGHPTIRQQAGTQQGYVHSISHGLGLAVHEAPWSGFTASDENILAPGVVVTVEPGLYYPQRGVGVRLENSLWMRPDGTPEPLADFPMDLVLPVRM